MHSGKNWKLFNPSLGLVMGAMLLCGSTVALAQKKTAAPAAPAPHAAAPAPHPAAPAAHAPAGGASRPATGMGGGGVPRNQPATGTNRDGSRVGGTPMNRDRKLGGINPGGMNPGHGLGGGVPRTVTTGRTAKGDEFARRSGGGVRDFHAADHGMNVHHSLVDGHRRVEVERADRSRIVAEHGGRGYVQHPYMYRNHEYAHRTYYHNGRIYDRYYGMHSYHGVYVNYYTPAYYYRPAFYSWAYAPWGRSVPYAWGWAGNPWYGYYGYYFTPYPVYPSAAAWLTDYMISVSLQGAYQNAVAANLAAGGPPPNASPLTPEVKEMISEEVRNQIALENAEAQNAQTGASDAASSSVQRMLTDNMRHVFLVGHELDVVNSQGAECAVSQGDALQLVGPPPPESQTAMLLVLSSKGGIECQRNDTVSVSIVDLQEMQNHMRETIQAGMGEMQSKQGGGLPAMPAAARGEPIKANFMTDAPPPDNTVTTQLSQQYNAGVAAEDQALGGGPQDARSIAPPMAPEPVPAPIVAPPAQPIQIDLGQTIEQVTAAMGTPLKIVDMNTRLIYVYKDLKITFKVGKVTNVE
jgi:hypothetical protein